MHVSARRSSGDFERRAFLTAFTWVLSQCNCNVLSYRPSIGSFGDNGSLSRASLSTRESLGGGNRHRGSSNDDKSGSSKTGDSSNSSDVRLSYNQTETCKYLPDGDILISGDLTRQGALSELVIFCRFIDAMRFKEVQAYCVHRGQS